MKNLNFGHIFKIKMKTMKSIGSGILLTIIAVLGLNAQSVQDGLRHLENENYKSAMEVFDKLIENQPKAYINHYYKAEVYMAMGDFKAAKSAYQKGLETSSKCDECHVGLGKLELQQNNGQEAKKHLEGALKGNSKNAPIQALVGKAYLYIEKPQAENALIYLEKARDLDPKQAKYWIYLGDAYQIKGDLGQAMTAFETAVEKDKHDPETYVKMARIWADGKNLELAIERLETAIKLNPGYAIAYRELYEMYIRSRKLDKVLPILDKYVALSGTDLDAKVRLVKFLCFQAKDYNRAIVEANKILVTHPDQYTLHRWLAWSYFENGEYNYSLQSSYRLFNAVEKGDPATQKLYPSDYEYAGKASLKLKLADTTEMFFKRLIQLQPDREVELSGTLAKAFYDIKRYDKAEAWYLKKDTLSPLTSELLYLGMAQKFQKKYHEADTTFAELLIKTPNYEYGWLQRADIQHKLDTAEAKSFLAKPFYDKFIELASAAPSKNKTGLIEAYLYMLVYNAQMGTYDAAKSYCEMVLNIDPEESRALEYSKILNGGSGQKPKNR